MVDERQSAYTSSLTGIRKHFSEIVIPALKIVIALGLASIERTSSFNSISPRVARPSSSKLQTTPHSFIEPNDRVLEAAAERARLAPAPARTPACDPRSNEHRPHQDSNFGEADVPDAPNAVCTGNCIACPRVRGLVPCKWLEADGATNWEVSALSTLLVSLKALQPRQSSLFVNGFFPRRRWLVLGVGLVAGLVLAYVWYAKLTDSDIGFNTANGLLGRNANNTAIGGVADGVLFAFVAGLAGSFTACNIAVFGAVGPLLGEGATSRGNRLLQTLKPLGWMAVGMIPVSAIYGAIVGIVGTRMPQFSTAKVSHGVSARSIQSMAVFGGEGLIMIALGLAALGLIPDPLARISRRFQSFPLVLMGALVGGFLIGRPYPLFRDLFRSAANHHNPAYGAGAFVLQSLGNMVVMGVLFIVLSYAIGGRVQRWVSHQPSRASTLTASALIISGAYFIAYWNLRQLGHLGYLWFPTAPWNS
jgi:hypothetical protein